MESAVPVVFLIFNRPDLTARVFDAIAAAKPKTLLVVADGPRATRADDVEKCEAARAIVDHVSWDCEVLRNYSDANVGCGRRVSSGITWAFQHVDEAIILEDDCVPDPSFFPFCAELLNRYRDDERVMMVGGTNLLGKWRHDAQSYHFSYHIAIWGWATWRRAWCHYDYDMRLWQHSEARRVLKDVLCNENDHQRRVRELDNAYAKGIDAWSYQWMLACLMQSGLAILPAVNLVTNVGFRDDATHTGPGAARRYSVPSQSMVFPLRHPIGVAPDRAFDDALLRLFGSAGRRRRAPALLRPTAWLRRARRLASRVIH